ncbi:MAG: 4Fe-4S dicluster domain-containing protein [Coriobacteriales bacterium]|nr:4Fe-4S dicluster domain-containing protein [Coriobacteriales bacterium]
MTRYAMAIDKARCIGCKTCLMACKVSNNLPKGVWYNRYETEGAEHEYCAVGEFPQLSMVSYTVACQHCANPACVAVCPTNATQQDENGIVFVDESLCIGCKACIDACPYDVRTLLEEVEPYADVTFGRPTAKEHMAGTVEKCDFCRDLIEQGKNPACMDLCPARARFWGDIEDPESEISKLIAEREYDLLKEDMGTQPMVFYLK